MTPQEVVAENLLLLQVGFLQGGAGLTSRGLVNVLGGPDAVSLRRLPDRNSAIATTSATTTDTAAVASEIDAASAKSVRSWRGRVEDARQGRRADRAPDALAGLQRAARRARHGHRDAAQRHRRVRGDTQPPPMPATSRSGARNQSRASGGADRTVSAVAARPSTTRASPVTVSFRPDCSIRRPPTTGDHRAERERRDGQARLQRGVAQTRLQVQREHQPDPAEADEVDGAQQHAGGVAGGAGQQVEIEERRPSAPRRAAPTPRRPRAPPRRARTATTASAGRSPRPAPAGASAPARPRRAARRRRRRGARASRPETPDESRGEHECDDADRHVDEEDPAPAPCSPVNARINPPAIGPTAVDSPTVAPKNPNARAALVPAEQLLDQRRVLRCQRAGRDTLRQPGHDQHAVLGAAPAIALNSANAPRRPGTACAAPSHRPAHPRDQGQPERSA